MPSTRRLTVRSTTIDLMEDGAGAPLLFLHGAGGAVRWLPFHARLAERFAVRYPVHPGHGGSPEADWIEHVSDLAFHYLDLLDELALDRVHLVGASFGGWIAAEVAVMASHRLRSLTLIDPVGIKVDGWIYPFLFGMELPELVGMIFQKMETAMLTAPEDMTAPETLITLYRQNTALARVAWSPYLYDPLLRRRLARITAPTLLCWGAHDRLAPVSPCAQAWQKEIPGATLRVFEESGHVPHLEEPDAVARAVTDFCGREGGRA